MHRNIREQVRSHHRFLIFGFILFGCSLTGCNPMVLDPTPVVPTSQPVAYSARVELADAGIYMVQPGASMIPDLRLQNHVTAKITSLDRAKSQWEQAVIEYLAARKTFRSIAKTDFPDVVMTLRLFVYIDPSVSFKFNHVYVAKIDGALRDPRNGRVLLDHVGKGKAFGEVSRDGKDDDREPINRAIRAALNDLFGKLEQDKRLAHL